MKKKALRILYLIMAASFCQTVFRGDLPFTFFVVQETHAQEWKDEFDDICGKTTDAMKLSPEELKGLIERCHKLKVVIEQLEETQKKVYLKRLSLCQDLFVFVLQSKEKD
jgi:hypothetical protein